MAQSPKFQFLPLNACWVALHPQPVGVVHFIGGAFFGTFPSIFYRYLLRYIFEQGYTVIAIPYRFSFRHWSVATGLVRDQITLRAALIEEAKHRQYEYKIYQEFRSENYFWLGHSLGCKYITLLELLTDLEKTSSSEHNPIANFALNCLPPKEAEHLRRALSTVDLGQVSLENQHYILMAPAIEGLEGAIPLLRSLRFSGFKKVLESVGIKVEPSQPETFCLLKHSPTVTPTSLISFKGDTRVAAPTVRWLQENLKQRLAHTMELEGKHLAPLGWTYGDPIIAQTIGFFLTDSASKLLSS